MHVGQRMFILYSCEDAKHFILVLLLINHCIIRHMNCKPTVAPPSAVFIMDAYYSRRPFQPTPFPDLNPNLSVLPPIYRT